jgi:hypothetical protein
MDRKKLVRKEWHKRIEEWHQSGLSCSQWARNNNLPYHQALYWKEQYTKNYPIDSTSFVELPEKKSDQSGIVIEITNMKIHIAREFDSQTLLSCIQLLKQI